MLKPTGNKKEHKWLLPRLQLSSLVFGVMIFVIPLIFTVIIEFMNRGGISETASWIVSSYKSFAISYVTVFSLLNIFMFIPRERINLGLSIFFGILLSIMSYVSHLIMEFRGEPLSIKDLKLAGEGADIIQNFKAGTLSPVVALLCAAAIIIMFIVLFIKVKKVDESRYIIAVLSTVALFYLYWMNIYGFTKLGIDIPSDVTWNHQANGFIVGNLIDSKFMKIPKPKHYSKPALEDVYNNMKKQTPVAAPTEKPDIVYILSESFWDPTVVKGLKLSADPIPTYRKLVSEGISGTITVPGIGGGTANTEYEVLTGLSKEFINNYSLPYNPYNDYITRPVSSMASILSEQGYKTTALHTYHSWFYRRDEVYKDIGFDKFISLEDLPETPSYLYTYVKDTEINNMIQRETEAANNKPSFTFAATMQLHGPYDNFTVKDKKISVLSPLSSNSKQIVENYANVLNESDKDLNSLIEYYKNSKRPTILVFFGDHIPALGNNVYNELNFDLTKPQAKKTPVLIWSNYKKLSGTVDMDANYISPLVMDVINNKSSLYMNYLDALYKKAPHISQQSAGAMYSDFELLQYDIMHGSQYYYDLAGQPKVNSSYTEGNPLSLKQALIQENDISYTFNIIGTGIGAMSKLYINGEKTNFLLTDGKMAAATLPKDKIKENETVEFMVETRNSKNIVIAKSNVLKYANLDALKKEKVGDKGIEWNTVKLDGTNNWEFFSSGQGYKIVRVYLQLNRIPYVAMKNNAMLRDTIADVMKEGNLSNLYGNGYLYISVWDNDSGWGNEVTTASIKQYFTKNNYRLYFLAENEDD